MKIKKIIRPLILSGVSIAGYSVLRWFHSHLLDERHLDYLLVACLASASVVLVRSLGFVVFDVIFLRRKAREAPELLRALFSVIAYSFLFTMIYSSVLHKNVTGIMTTSAVVTVLVGLALQDTIGNFFAGISFHVENPFHIGDAIKIRDQMGRVEAVTWRTTTIRTSGNSVVIFPNSMVAREPLEIYSSGELNQRLVTFPAPYSVSPQKVVQLVSEAIRTVDEVAPETAPMVRIKAWEDSDILYEVVYWIKDYIRVSQIDSIIRERIWYVLQRNQIDFSFPTRQILFESSEDATIRTKDADEADYRAIIEGIDIFKPLTAQEKEIISKALVRYLYAPGEIIIQCGDAADSSMFVIRRGKVDVRLPSSNGPAQSVAVLGRGDFIGEMSLFTGEPRSADVSAIEETEILEIRKGVIERLFCQNAQLAEAFSCKIAERQTHLRACSLNSTEDTTTCQEQTILQKIRNFFNLGG